MYMKRSVFLLFFLFSLARAETQLKKSNTGRPIKTSNKKLLQNKPAGSEINGSVISLISTSTHPAKAPTNLQISSKQLTISDPTIRALQERAKGNDVYVSNSGIVGMSKRAYGFANGHILLHSTVATSSGSTGGSSSVGTGGSVGGVGSSGQFIGLNGKSPHAGQAMWGNAYGIMNAKF
jgi:hypothetical protein